MNQNRRVRECRFKVKRGGVKTNNRKKGVRVRFILNKEMIMMIK